MALSTTILPTILVGFWNPALLAYWDVVPWLIFFGSPEKQLEIWKKLWTFIWWIWGLKSFISGLRFTIFSKLGWFGQCETNLFTLNWWFINSFCVDNIVSSLGLPYLSQVCWLKSTGHHWYKIWTHSKWQDLYILESCTLIFMVPKKVCHIRVTISQKANQRIWITCHNCRPNLCKKWLVNRVSGKFSFTFFLFWKNQWSLMTGQSLCAIFLQSHVSMSTNIFKLNH